VLHPVASVETHTVVPPLNTDPITVGPIATPIDPTDGPTNDNGGGVNAGRAGRAGNVGKAARGADGVAALASATGAAITAAAEIAAAATARRLIHVTRLFLSIDFSLGRPRQHRPDHEDEHSAAWSAYRHPPRPPHSAGLISATAWRPTGVSRMPNRPVSHRPGDPLRSRCFRSHPSPRRHAVPVHNSLFGPSQAVLRLFKRRYYGLLA
jgi:hypothetical protein